MLNKTQTIIYRLGGLLLLAGAILPTLLTDTRPAPYVYTAGALMFCSMQLLDRYDGTDITIRRLRRQQVLGACCLLAAGALMFCSQYGLGPLRGAEWQMALAIGAVLETYSAFRLPAELERERKARGKDF